MRVNRIALSGTGEEFAWKERKKIISKGCGGGVQLNGEVSARKKDRKNSKKKRGKFALGDF